MVQSSRWKQATRARKSRRNHRLELAPLRTPPASSSTWKNGVPREFVVAGRLTSPETEKILVPPLFGLPCIPDRSDHHS